MNFYLLGPSRFFGSAHSIVVIKPVRISLQTVLEETESRERNFLQCSNTLSMEPKVVSIVSLLGAESNPAINTSSALLYNRDTCQGDLPTLVRREVHYKQAG